MKRFIAILGFSALATGAFAQGTILIGNGSYAFARTNAIGVGGTAGNTAPVLGSFYYAVFTAASTVTSIDANLQNLLTSTWTFTGLYATNSAVATGGRLVSGAGAAPTLQGWAPGVTNSYLVLGWSAPIAGQNVQSVLNQLAGAQLIGGVWEGGGFATNPLGIYDGFIGVTAIGFGEAGGGTTGLPAYSIFGPAANAQGTPIGSIGGGPNPFTMFVVGCPEPDALALSAIGFLALFICRRLTGRSRFQDSS